MNNNIYWLTGNLADSTVVMVFVVIMVMRWFNENK